ncbi:MAG: serine/threonine protein kinase [Acidimicrobiales bacterium]
MSRLAVGRFDDPDHYELGEAVASGGEATLHRGWVRGPGGRIPVAIKIPLPEWAPHLDRLYGRWSEQVELLRTLRHPGIVTVRELFVGSPPHSPGEMVEGRQLYLVMDWVAGTPLDEWLLDHVDANHLRRVRSVAQVADVLDRIHALRLEDAEAIVHRDVKPNNIIMGEHGPVLVDWGLVRGVVPNATRFPGEGGPGYMAPEVVREGRFSPASDRFAFGCVVYYLLTGRHPPDGHDLDVLRTSLLAVPGLAHQGATVEHIMAMFDPDPAERPTSCRSWLAGITRSTVAPVDSTIPPPAPKPPLPVRRSHLAAGAVCLVALALGAFLLWPDGDTPSTATLNDKGLTTSSSTSTSSTRDVSTTTSVPPSPTTTASTTPTTLRAAQPVSLTLQRPVEGSADVRVERAIVSGDPYEKSITGPVLRPTSGCGATERYTEYSVGGDFSRLSGTFGLEDEQSLRSIVLNVEISTEVAGAQPWTRTVRFGEDPAVDLDIKGALRVRITVSTASAGPYNNSSCTIGKWVLAEPTLLP